MNNITPAHKATILRHEIAVNLKGLKNEDLTLSQRRFEIEATKNLLREYDDLMKEVGEDSDALKQYEDILAKSPDLGTLAEERGEI